MDVIYSSPLLRRIWHDPYSIDFWAVHALSDGNQFYICKERLEFLPGEQSYQYSQPTLVRNRGNKLDSEKLRQKTMRKIQWAVQRKYNKGYTTVLELNQCFLRELECEVFDNVLEEAKVVGVVLEDDF